MKLVNIYVSEAYGVILEGSSPSVTTIIVYWYNICIMKNSFEDQPVSVEEGKKKFAEIFKRLEDPESIGEVAVEENRVVSEKPVKKVTPKSHKTKDTFGSLRTGAAAMDEWQRKQDAEQEKRWEM